MFLYDFLRMSRRLMPCPDFLVNIEDILFSALSAVLVFYITYVKNNGEIRWQTAVGLGIGIAVYVITIGDKWVKIGCVFIKLILNFLFRFIRIILSPFIVLIKVIIKPFRVVFWYSGKGVNFLKVRAKITAKNALNILRKK